MKVDYIIVGCGLAGLNFCELLDKNKKSYVVFDNASQQSSTVAGGLYNPVVLKRFTPVWKSEEQLELVSQVYTCLEKKLDKTLDYKIPVKRVFHSVEEQNDWIVASDKKGLSPYLSTSFLKNNNPYINAPFGFGVVNHTGRIDTPLLISEYKKYLKDNGQLLEQSFEYSVLELKEKGVSYENIEAKHVVFSEGFGLKQNPFFNKLPLKGTKGELLTIHATDLKIDYVLKSSAFLIPFGNDEYRVGATYEWTDKTNVTTDKAKKELLEKLYPLISCPYKIIAQHAGIRPTVIDRRPLVGTHSNHNCLHVLNGLGTRGVMIAPYVAKALYDSIENKVKLDQEIDINRF